MNDHRLNVLNGDATLHQFELAALPGDVLVWREILSEGPVVCGKADDLFSLRSRWIADVFESYEEEYRQKVVAEYKKLIQYRNYKEVILWFEFDLTCQINLIFLLDFLHRHPADSLISLICPDSHPNHPDFKGLGELTPQELSGLINRKTTLAGSDLQLASEAWMAYCTNDKDQIKNFLSRDFGRLPLLKAAFEAHLKRFPDNNGLNKIDKTLIEIIDSGVRKREDIYTRFWQTEKIYGMGDLSIDSYLNKLEKGGYINLR